MNSGELPALLYRVRTVRMDTVLLRTVILLSGQVEGGGLAKNSPWRELTCSFPVAAKAGVRLKATTFLPRSSYSTVLSTLPYSTVRTYVHAVSVRRVRFLRAATHARTGFHTVYPLFFTAFRVRHSGSCQCLI